MINLQIAGDYAVRKDNQPKGENIGGFLHKTMRIAGSGIYKYHRSEAPLFGLDPSHLPAGQMYFNIYRPPEVLKKHKDMFARVPLITGKHVQVTSDNAKELTVGWVGDTVDWEIDPNDGELYLYTTGTIIAGDGIRAYEESGQLSVGYVPTAHWESGTHRGEKYDAVLDSFRDVNHILLCREARGGPQIMVMDSLDSISPLEKFIESYGGNKVTVFQKIFGSRASNTPVAGDARVPVLLQSIAAGADPEKQVKAIREIVGDAKTDVQKEFHSYLDELAACKDEAPEVKAKAIEIVEEFYKTKIAGDAMSPDKDKGSKVDDKPADSTGKEKTAGEDDDKEDEEEDEDEKEKEKKKKEKEKLAAGDAFPVNSILETLESINKRLESLEKTRKPTISENPEAIGALRVLIGGDSADSSKKRTSSDEFLRSIL